MNFATKLRALRCMMELTQSSIADALGIERATYAKYESGHTSPPADVVYLLSQLFSLPLDYLSAAPPQIQEAPFTFSDHPLLPWETNDSDDKTSDDLNFGALTPEEKMLVVRFRLKKATEQRRQQTFPVDELDLFVEQFMDNKEID